MSVLTTPEIITPVTATFPSSESAAPEAAPSQEVLLASVVAAEIVVPANAHAAPKRKRKVPSSPQCEIERLRQALEEERRLHAIQRAAAEQSRRVADCLTVFQDALLANMTQPCFILNATGSIHGWNPAMAHWTARSAAATQGRTLADWFGEETGAQLERACRLAQAAIANAEGLECGHAFSLPGPYRFGDVTASRLTLIPRYRIPRFVEAFFVLVTPDEP